MLRKLALVFYTIFAFTVAFAQSVPCMPTWHYRKPVTINNSANSTALTQYQTHIDIDTKALVDAGKMKADGGDIRFVNAAGVPLPHWVENGTMYTDATRIWIKVDNIPSSGNILIYLFYGKTTANSSANGTSTFLHYDNFDGNSLDFNKWTYCGGALGGTTPVVSGGEVTLGSFSGVYNQSITSSTNFSGPIKTEMKVNSFSTGTASLAQVNAAKNGYGMALENASNTVGMRLVSTNSTTRAGVCLQLVNQSTTNSISAGPTQGLWSFTWSQPNEQKVSWPGGSFTRTDNLDASGFSLNKNVNVGSYSNTGSISLDYIYTRKYTAEEPTSSLGTETELVDYVDATTDAPVCVGSPINLMAPSFTNAIYSWTGPNGFSSTDQNPTIGTSVFNNVGKYTVVVSGPAGCSAVQDSVIVTLDSVPIAGVLSSDAKVCSGMNGDNIILTGTTGKIAYWETSPTLIGPWNAVMQTSSSIAFKDNLITTYYRSLVSSGTCGSDTSNVVTITVDERSRGGNLLGSKDICSGYNEDSITAINYQGAIQKWEMEEGSGWTDVPTISNTVSYTNKTLTTAFRMLVKNGVCPEVYSDTATLTARPLPVVGFSATSQCLGVNHNFINTSQISQGTIDDYTWRFGDGKGASIAAPSHKYDSVKTYTVNLKAVSNFGCIDYAESIAIVDPLPAVSYVWVDVCDTSTMNFTNSSTIRSGTLASYAWDFGDMSVPSTTSNTSHKYAKYGEYTTQLKITSDKGCIDSTSNEVEVLRRAVVSFVSDSVCFGATAHLTNTTFTEADSTTYTWNLGNGNFVSETNPKINYSVPGKYEIVLAATSFGQCVNIAIDTLIVYPTPIADFTFDNVCRYDSLKLINNSTIDYSDVSYSWNFGDSITSSMKAPSHLYAKPDNYYVSMNVTSEFGCTDSKILLTEIHPIPKADFQANTVCRDTLTKFTNLSTILPNKMTYSWDFADGRNGTVEHPGNIYAAHGTYAVKLVTTSDYECTDSITKDVTVYPRPVAQFISDSICYGFETKLANTTTLALGAVDYYLWDIGDNSNSIVRDTVTHKYAKAGSYDVNLKAVSDKGCDHDSTITIVVHPNPVADFSFDNNCVDNNIKFNNESSIDFGVQTFGWKFGDNSESTDNSPIHVYNDFGFFPVQLIAKSQENCKDSIVKIVEVYSLPLVYAGKDTSVSFGFYQALEGICLNASAVTWTPAATVANNSVLVTEARPLETTEYTLEITDVNGCLNSDKMIMEVIQEYKLLISNVITPNGDGDNDTWQIFNASSFDVVHIMVLDQWGREVYQADNYSKAWDGNVNLDNLAEGTYIYLITFDESDRVYKGAVNILR